MEFEQDREEQIIDVFELAIKMLKDKKIEKLLPEELNQIQSMKDWSGTKGEWVGACAYR